MKLIRQRDVPDMLQARLPADLHPVLRRIYAGRQIRTAEELDNGLARLLPPAALKDIECAVGLLETAVCGGQRILVVGDFDADGATSSALMVSGLRAMGAQSVDYLVPNRFEFGYGLTPEIVAVAAERAPDLLITVDNGISSVAGVAAARAHGMRVLVTDHHLPGSELPQADAILNPNQAGDSFPSKCLAGVGVAFYLLLALRGRLRDRGWFAAHGRAEPNLADYLDLVALGTVADLVPLDRNNRVLVQQGMQRIRAGRCRPGIRALLDVAGRNPARLVAADFGFGVGPRLNAAGRLDDMSLGIECLLCEDPVRARALREALERLVGGADHAPVSVMHVCGSHEQAIAKFGLRAAFPRELQVIMGPGCPVCVTDVPEVDEAVVLAKQGVRVASYGDMLRVPGTSQSLNDAKADGAKVDVVYSVTQAVELAKTLDEEVVFFASGFETTAVATAAILVDDPPDNFSVLSAHKYIPPVMEIVAGNLEGGGHVEYPEPFMSLY